MKTFFKFCLFVFFYIKLSFLLISCQQPVAINNSLEKNTNSNQKTESVNLDKQTALTPTQLAAIFPAQLSGLEKTIVNLNPKEDSATAFYGNNKYTIRIIDDLQHNYANLNLFNKRYQTKVQKKVKQTIKTVRDGYKTIATINDSGVTSISFVFKDRYLFTITGNDKQTPYMVWRFLELNKFQTLQ